MASLACGLYSNYLFFLLRDRYGFGNVGNLGISALQGLVWALASWQGGRFAQRFGYAAAIRVSLGGMSAALLAGAWFRALAAQIAVVVLWTAASCFIWPALEALVSEGTTERELPARIGVYNVVWAACSGLSYFFGGAVFEHLGAQSLFWLPIGVYLALFVLLRWHCARKSLPIPAASAPNTPGAGLRSDAGGRQVSPLTFLRMAWLANPSACIGINTLLATIPGLARDLRLSPTASGLFCSLWFFARLGAFILLWRWYGWHYRFRWLAGAFLGLVAGLAAMLISRNYWLLSAAQVVFGLSVGLIYYSSLFYSMDVGATKGQHGGLHEAAMGAGNCLGPAVAMGALTFAPQYPQAGAYAVSGLLALGGLGLLRLWLCGRTPPLRALANFGKWQ